MSPALVLARYRALRRFFTPAWALRLARIGVRPWGTP